MAAESVIEARVVAAATDLALIARARRGDAEAFELLLAPRFWRLGRLAMSITGNQSDADDAIQIGCLRAWRELARLREPASFDSWLWRIVVNACRNVVRGRSRLTVHEITVPADELGDRHVAADPGPVDIL